MVEKPTYLDAAAVFVGALVLFGVPTMLVVFHGATLLGATINQVLGVGPTLVGVGAVLATVGALVVGWVVATEITRVRLHGFAELSRGPTTARRFVRHGLLYVAVGTWTVGLVYFQVNLLQRSLELDTVHSYWMAAGLIGTLLATGYALVKIGEALVDGYRVTA